MVMKIKHETLLGGPGLPTCNFTKKCKSLLSFEDQLSTDKKTIFIVKLREGHIHLKTTFIIIYFNYFFIIYKPGLNITQVLTFNIIQYFFQNSGTFRRLHP